MKTHNIASALAFARQHLQAQGMRESAALDARLLLQASLKISHEDIIAEPEKAISAESFVTYQNLVLRRGQAEPVAKILGHKEFYGRSFQVSPAVLDPRPDTEILVEAALDAARTSNQEPCRILELGVGSGAVIISLLAELQTAIGVAVDISEDALRVAAFNQQQHAIGARLALLKSDWFSAVEGKFNLIVSNPPYIASAEIASLSNDVKHFDPLLALDGGSDGLAPYRIIAATAVGFLIEGGRVFVEIGAGQEMDVTEIFKANGFSAAAVLRDLAGHVRCLGFQLL